MPNFNSDEIGSGDTSALAGNYWQEAGNNEFNSQSVGFSAGGTDECQQFSDYQHFRTFYEPLPLILPSGSVNSCSFGQPGDGTVWTSQTAETGRGMTVECIQAGEAAFSLGQTSTSSEDLSDEIVSFLAFPSTVYPLPTCWYGVQITKCNSEKLLEIVIKTWKLSLRGVGGGGGVQPQMVHNGSLFWYLSGFYLGRKMTGDVLFLNWYLLRVKNILDHALPIRESPQGSYD